MARKTPRFIALDDKPMEMAIPSNKSDAAYFPTAHIYKEIPGLDEVGETKTVRMKVRVSSVEKRKGQKCSTGLELLGIQVEG